MLLHNDVVTNRETKSSALASRLGGEEGIEYFVSDVGRNARSIVPYSDFYSVAKIFGGSGEGRLKAVAPNLPFALSSCVKAV